MWSKHIIAFYHGYTNTNWNSTSERVKKSNQNNTTKSGLDFLNNETSTMFGMNMFKLMEKINKFLPDYKKLTNIAEKQTNLIGLVMSISNVWLKS